MPTPEAPGTPPLSGARVVLRALIVLMLVAIVALAVLNVLRIRQVASEAGTAELPVLAVVPELELVRADGEPVTRADLAGMPWVADFVFTRCVTSCPIMTSRMQGVGSGLVEGEEFRRVSISVDPAYDTPEVLREYQRARRLPESWWWLTGEPEAVLPLVREGFLLGVEPNPGDPNDPILHSTRLVLVDAENRIRGYYDAMDGETLERLENDLAHLAGD